MDEATGPARIEESNEYGNGTEIGRLRNHCC